MTRSLSRRRRRRRGQITEIRYEPRNVKEILTEMKDLSESIIDLSYSAIIFNSERIADEVQEMEERMDFLLYQIRMTAMLAVRNPDEAEQMAGILQVANAAENISNAAGDITRLLEIDIEHRPFLPSILKEADEKIMSLRIQEGSDLTGRRVGELGVESETGARIIAVRRRKRWFYEIEGDFKLKSGDFVITRGVEDGYEYLKRCADGDLKWGEDDE